MAQPMSVAVMRGGTGMWRYDDDLGVELFDQAESFGVIGGFADEFDIVGGLQEAAESAADGVKVIGDDYADGHGILLFSRWRVRATIG